MEDVVGKELKDDWTVDDWADLHSTIQGFRQRLRTRHTAPQTEMWVEFNIKDCPPKRVDELAVFPSGRIVVMADGDSFWFEKDGSSPKYGLLVTRPANDRLLSVVDAKIQDLARANEVGVELTKELTQAREALREAMDCVRRMARYSIADSDMWKKWSKALQGGEGEVNP